MKDVIKFILFLTYATLIFFLPNHSIILFAFLIHFSVMLFTKCTIKSVIRNIAKFSPFIFLTAFINCLLGDFVTAFWISIKLLLVCNITFIYSQTTTVTRTFKNNQNTLYSIKAFQN